MAPAIEEAFGCNGEGDFSRFPDEHAGVILIVNSFKLGS